VRLNRAVRCVYSGGTIQYESNQEIETGDCGSGAPLGALRGRGVGTRNSPRNGAVDGGVQMSGQSHGEEAAIAGPGSSAFQRGADDTT